MGHKFAKCDKPDDSPENTEDSGSVIIHSSIVEISCARI